MTGELLDRTRALTDCCEPVGAVVLAVMPSIPVGGMERANIEIFRLLKERGARVVVATHDGHGKRVENACRMHGIETISVSVHCDTRVPRNPIRFLGYLGQWINFVREIRRAHRAVRPDWLYMTNLTYFLYSWPILLCSRARTVFTLPVPPDAPRGKARAAFNRLVWRRLVAPVCATIICNSCFTRDRLLATGARPRFVEVIYNSLPHREPTGGRSPVEDDHGRLRVTYVGRLTPAKGITQLFEAALALVRERADVEFCFAGDYEWRNPFAKELVQKVESLGLDDRVKFLGETEDVLELLAASDVHVLFSTEEAFGLVVLEAKSQGVPSVVSPGGALPELVEHGVDGYVCGDFTTAALREGIEYFLTDKTARLRAGRSASESMQKFARERIGKRWSRVLGLDE